MDDLQHRLLVSQWIAEEFAGIIDEDRRAKLEAWRKESAGNEQEYQELLQEFRSGDILEPYPEEEIGRQWKKFSKRNRTIHPVFRYWYRYVALIVLLLGAAGVLKWQLDETRKTSERTTQTISLAQGSPLLVLADGRTMLLNDSVGWGREADLQQVRLDEQGITYQQSDSLEKEEVFNTLIIPKGGEFQIQLADGSRVWLNSETELRYPVNFTAEKRRVFLKGEAYFEVAPDSLHPFIVKTEQQNLRVLGTSFAIRAYANESVVLTTLETGKVNIHSKGQEVILTPGKQSCLKDGNLTVAKVNTTLFTAWHKGIFIFQDQPLENILNTLARWYNIDIFYTNENLKDIHFTGELKRYDRIQDFLCKLEILEKERFTIKGRTVTVSTY